MVNDDIPPPSRLKKGTPPSLDDIKNNLKTPNEDGSRVTLTFKVSNDFRKDLKIRAAATGITLQQLLEQAIQLWKDKYS